MNNYLLFMLAILAVFKFKFVMGIMLMFFSIKHLYKIYKNAISDKSYLIYRE